MWLILLYLLWCFFRMSFRFSIFLKILTHYFIFHSSITPPRLECRIIGVQSFKGSLRRTCFISPTRGETSPIQNSNQFCGGYIDPVSLETLGYIKLDGEPVRESKGYVCPLGQICTVCVGFSIVLTNICEILFFGREIWE